ncbi:hypothetical protein [uncultured Acetatifactor sp.]|jgi:hypothetical protein|uniref:hypothetical protein n=1 Tax=uncultured Acetatifactor sp. TaxID=1671927 RepID=UPI00263271B9|nr:hypothetical protein [uncultured Acetatifactor sp.]
MEAVNHEEQLARIADALEGINSNLDSISSFLSEISVSLYSLDKTLDGCTCTNGRSHFLCITGNVSTD